MAKYRARNAQTNLIESLDLWGPMGNYEAIHLTKTYL